MVTAQSRENIYHFQNQQQVVNNLENAVFVSYAWGGESERNVDDLERAFVEYGILIVRDKKDMDYKGSIETFEQRIGRGKCIILVISDKYLRSEHCMYELVKVNENQNLRERIFPVLLADARIYNPMDRLSYIKYWDEQIEKLNQAIKEVKVMTNLSSIITDLEKYIHIRASFDYLTDLLSDMNALTPEIHADNGFSTLISAVERSMDRNQISSKSVMVMDSPMAATENTSEQLPSMGIDSKSWEEFATFLPKTAPDIDKLMFAVYYHFDAENADTVEMKTITNNYFRRARWSRPVNLSATANYCASKGWLSEVGKTKSQKLWKITKHGYETVKAKMAQL